MPSLAPPAAGRRRRLAVELALLLAIAGAGLWLRAYLPWEQVFVGDEIQFRHVDSWYHMRLAQSAAANFPHRIDFDPYLLYPGGQEVRVAPLLDQTIAGAAWLLSAGRPDQRTVEVVGAWLPALSGVLTLLPLFFLGRRLFGGRGALLGCLLMALLPGRFLLFSRLGATDHHVAEVLLSLATLALLARGLERERRGASEAVAAGLCLALYLLTWTSGAFLVAILLAWGVIENLLGLDDPERRQRVRRLGTIACASAGALLLLAGGAGDRGYIRHDLVGLAASVAAFPLLGLVAGRCAPRRRGRGLFALAVVALAAGGALAVRALAPGAWADLASQLGRLGGGARAATVAEAAPLFFRDGGLTLDPYLFEFSTPALLFPLALVLLARRWWRERPPAALLFLVWAAAVGAAAVAQSRFATYLTAVVALAVGDLCARFVWSKRSGAGAIGPPLRFLAVFLLVVYPTLVLAIPTAGRSAGPEREWSEALRWLRDSSPEPMPEGAFLDRYEAPPPGQPYAYPEQAYGVVSWWDYGYWLIYRARRIPAANPTQAGATEVAELFLAQDEAGALARLSALGGRYVVADRSLLAWLRPGEERVGGSFGAVVAWSGEPAERFYEVLYRRRGDELEAVPVFHPAYYRSLLVRLWAFAGEAVTPAGASTVVTLAERAVDGETRREIEDAVTLPTYDEAEVFVASHPGAILVGLDPSRSPVPLAPIERLEMLYGTPQALIAAEPDYQLGVAIWGPREAAAFQVDP